MNCNTTHYRANSSSVPGDPTWALAVDPDAVNPTYGTVTAPRGLETELPLLRGRTAQRARVATRAIEVMGVAYGDDAWVYVAREGGPAFLQTEMLLLRRLASLTSGIVTSDATASLDLTG